MSDEKPELWFAYEEGLPPGYANVVGPFLDGDEALDFVEARNQEKGRRWDSTIMTYPEDWKPLYFPGEKRP